jgi:hypothetical protein
MYTLFCCSSLGYGLPCHAVLCCAVSSGWQFDGEGKCTSIQQIWGPDWCAMPCCAFISMRAALCCAVLCLQAGSLMERASAPPSPRSVRPLVTRPQQPAGARVPSTTPARWVLCKLETIFVRCVCLRKGEKREGRRGGFNTSIAGGGETATANRRTCAINYPCQVGATCIT